MSTGAAMVAGGGAVAVGGVGVGGGGGGGTGGRKAERFAPPIAALLPVGEIATGAEVSTQGSASVVGVPATFRPPASLHATWRASWESDASTATPAAPMKQSTGPGRAWPTPLVDSRAILPTVCPPLSHCSNSRAESAPLAATSVRRSSSPTPLTSSQPCEGRAVGRRGVLHVDGRAGVRDHARAENRRVLLPGQDDRVERAVGHRSDVGARARSYRAAPAAVREAVDHVACRRP